MTSPAPDKCWGIGDLARRTGATERTLRSYEELGLLAPIRDAGGRRRYDGRTLDRLYRIRLLRELGTPVADVNPDADDLRELTRRLLDGDRPGDEALLDLLSGLPADEPALTRRITLLVYRDISAGHAYLVDVLGLAAGPISYDGDRAVHGEVHAGDGVVWLHREAPEHRMVSPLTTGTVTASLAVLVDDVDAHHARVAATGAAIDTDQPTCPTASASTACATPRATSGHSRHRSPSSTNRL